MMAAMMVTAKFVYAAASAATPTVRFKTANPWRNAFRKRIGQLRSDRNPIALCSRILTGIGPDRLREDILTAKLGAGQANWLFPDP
jgi:hypothetical protein